MSDRFKIHSGDSGGYSPPGYYKEGAEARIDVTNPENMEKWARLLELSQAELLAAINDFGPIVRHIRKGLLARRNEAA